MLVTGAVRCKYTKTTKTPSSPLWMLLTIFSKWARQKSGTPRGEQDPQEADQASS